MSETIQVEVFMDSGSRSAAVPGDGTDVSSVVTSASFGYGKRHPYDEWRVNTAKVFLKDNLRTFDPNNTASPHNGKLKAGKQIAIRVLDPNGAQVRLWRGFIRRWEPHYSARDSSCQIELHCVDRLGGLVAPLPTFPNEMLARKLSNNNGAMYRFLPEYLDTGTDVAYDLSGFGRDAYGRTWPALTPELIQDPSGDGVVFSEQRVIVPDTPRDTLLDSSEGWMVAAEVTIASHSPSSGTLRNWGILLEGSNTPSSGQGQWRLYLEATQTTSGVAAATDVMRLRTQLTVDGVVVENRAIGAGTRADWVGQRRVVAFGSTSTSGWLGCCVPKGASGSIQGSQVRIFPYSTPGKLKDQSLQAANAWKTYIGLHAFGGGIMKGAMHSFAFAHGSTDIDWGRSLLESFNEHEVLPPGVYQKILRVNEEANTPVDYMRVEIERDIQIAFGADVSDRTALEWFQRVVAMGQGRLFQSLQSGEIVLEDADNGDGSISTTAVEIGGEVFYISTSTDWPGVLYTDQGTPGGMPYKVDAISVFDDYDSVINHAEVTLPSGYVATSSNQTSINVHGLRALKEDYPFALASEADAFCASVVSRFKDPKPYVQLTVEPSSDPGWWFNLSIQEIGRQYQVQRQPLGVGSIIDIEQELIGEQWAWSASVGRFTVRQFFSPRRPGPTV